MTSDAQLLQRFVQENAQEAFAALVQRHVTLVYSAAAVEPATLAQKLSEMRILTELQKKKWVNAQMTFVEPSPDEIHVRGRGANAIGYEHEHIDCSAALAVDEASLPRRSRTRLEASSTACVRPRKRRAVLAGRGDYRVK